MSATPEQLRHRYELETRLARRILESTREERTAVTRACYDQMYREVGSDDCALPTLADDRQRGQLAPMFASLVGPGRRGLDVGCGPGDRAARIAAAGNERVGLDISEEILARAQAQHPKTAVAIGDAVKLDVVTRGGFHVSLTSQLIERLRPDDVPLHLEAVACALRPGGA